MVIQIGIASEPEFSTHSMMTFPLSYRKEVQFLHFLVFTDLGVPLTPCYLAPLVLYTPPYFRLPFLFLFNKLDSLFQSFYGDIMFISMGIAVCFLSDVKDMITDTL